MCFNLSICGEYVEPNWLFSKQISATYWYLQQETSLRLHLACVWPFLQSLLLEACPWIPAVTRTNETSRPAFGQSVKQEFDGENNQTFMGFGWDLAACFFSCMWVNSDECRVLHCSLLPASFFKSPQPLTPQKLVAPGCFSPPSPQLW